METCPRCGRRVEKLYPVVAEVFTKELLVGVEEGTRPSDLALCLDCTLEIG